jgi:hypothetical protein
MDGDGTLRNFMQLAAGVNITPLLHQIYLHPELWNQNTLRTAHEQSPHSQCDDILLRFQMRPDAADPVYRSVGIVDDPECFWYPAWDVLSEAHRHIFDLCRTVSAERIGRIIISRLPPGGVIPAHEDGGAVVQVYTRYQIPLQSLPGCVFECDEEKVQMASGDVWWFENRRRHSVINNSATDRISLICDLQTRRGR